MTAADDHLDLDLLAELDEGLGDVAGSRAHVDSCDECRQRLDQVHRTRTLLAELPAEAMPADVAARVHAALPEEPPRSTIVPAARRRRWTPPSFAFLRARKEKGWCCL